MEIFIPGSRDDDFEQAVYPSQMQVLEVPLVGNVPFCYGPDHGLLKSLPDRNNQFPDLVVFREQGTPLCDVVDFHSAALQRLQAVVPCKFYLHLNIILINI